MDIDLRNVREQIFNSIKEELLGPGSEQTGINIDEEIITDLPSKRYVTGILFNKNDENIFSENIKNNKDIEHNDKNLFDDFIENQALEFKKTIIKSEENNKFRNDFEVVDEEYYEDMTNAHIIKKSSMGLTFFVDRDIEEILVNLKGARYREVKTSECMISYNGDILPLEDSDIGSYIFYEDGFLKLKQRFNYKDILRWNEIGVFLEREEFKSKVYKLLNQCSVSTKAYKRKNIKFNNPYTIKFNNSNQGKFIIEKENLKVFVLKRKDNDKYSITVMFVNEAIENKEEKYVFQPEICINSKENGFKFVFSNNFKKSINPEIDLLYRNKKVFGIGHGVSVDYSYVNSKSGEGIIKTCYLPRYEVPNTNFEVPKVGNFDVLSMFNLSDLSKINKKDIIEALSEFIDKYEEWINEIKDEDKHIEKSLQDTINHNINNCNIAKKRMREGLNILISNEDAFKSFQLANKAMYIQRIQSECEEFVDSSEGFNVYKNFDINLCRWRGFQLAFLLMVISSISDKNNKFRNIVDLIWIPTGGGKTEAYLGVSAFTIFYRRITRKDNGIGTTIIMRYTLRLLAAQQFERACKLICACEYIRREDKVDLGYGPITIGLWIGSEQTPNSLLEAKKCLNEIKKHKNSDNKFQLLKCPWCGESLTRENKKYEESDSIGYDIPRAKKDKFIFKCTNNKCYYSEELPIQVIDECLYKEPPTLLFSTVDKFAMLPWKGEAINFFKYKKCDPPELIIQDELHLISGPLGTLVGLFETALDYLCTIDGIGPKIISSTATICEANDQVENLYNRKMLQFPPPGIEIEDSFFTKEEDLKNKPGRLYIGVMGIGQTQITTEIRLFASLLQRISKLNFSDDVLDKYWTLVSYFNSIRELGKAVTLVDDDVKDYMIRIASRTGALYDTRKVYSSCELTSRVSSSQIVKILDQLEKNKYPNNPINVLLATNMISVGVDVSRLNLMTIIGQPKLTSEYIQASSRVGRKDPGLVFTLYDGRKSRDESHYEIFQSYHQAFYKYVEPTSITPFSEPALDRMLHSVFITMVRHNNTVLNSEDSAKYFDEINDDIEKIKKYILNRGCSKNLEDKKLIEDKLEEIVERWKQKSDIDDIPLKYSKGENPLMNRFYQKSTKIKGFETMTSMRNVDGELSIKIMKREED